MKTKFIIIALLICSLTIQMKAQNASFGFNIGHGSYDLADFKELQTDALDIPFSNIAAVESFPNTINYHLYFEYRLKNRHTLGINTSYFATGGRNHVKDYSGEYKFDMLLNSNNIGLYYKNRIFKINIIDFNLSLETGLKYSNFELIEDLEVNNQNMFYVNYEFNSYTFYAAPYFNMGINVYKDVRFNINVGYEVNIANTLNNKENEDLELRSSSGIVKANWTGLRYSLGLSYSF